MPTNVTHSNFLHLKFYIKIETQQKYLIFKKNNTLSHVNSMLIKKNNEKF